LSDQPAIEYRPYTRADEEQIVDLLRISMKKPDFPDMPGFWRWKHYENPFGESPGLVAIGEGTVIGLRVFLRWEWRAKGRIFRAVRAVDTATHPDWGRRGIFEHMTREMIERLTADGMDFIFNTPNQYSMPGYLKMGWTLVGRLPLRIRPQRPSRVLKVAAQRSGLGGATAITELADNSVVLELLSRPAVQELTQAAENGSDGGKLSTVRTPAYLEWRYGHNRWYSYRAGFDSRGDSAALVIARSSRRGALNELLVTDVVTSPDRGSRRLAAGIARGLAAEAKADYIAVSAFGDALGASNGYWSIGQRGPNMTVRPLREGLAPDPRVFASWGAAFGDLELF
jgi:hypothetical protein